MLDDVVILENVNFIGNGAFKNCSGLTKMTVFSAIPPQLTYTTPSNVFDGSKSEKTLYVNSSSIDAFRNSEWNNCFSEIKVFDNNNFLFKASEHFNLLVPDVRVWCLKD